VVATVVGSGIMAETLTKDVALALLGNTLPTGAILVVLITILGPISGAHFNPAVTLVFALKRDISPPEAGAYILAQIAGAVAGAIVAHLMFGLPIVEFSTKSEPATPNGSPSSSPRLVCWSQSLAAFASLRHPFRGWSGCI